MFCIGTHYLSFTIDHGNYAIKTPHDSFVSGLSEHTVKPPMTEEILEYKGKYWTLSSQRLSYMRDKTRDDRYFILSLFAIAKEMERSGHYSPLEQIQLAVGLPPEHYGILKDKFARYFRRGFIEFAYKGRPYKIMIDRVMVFPQAYAAVVPQSSLVVHTLRIFIIDVGGYTTDVLLLQNGKPDLQFCRSLETGIITMNNEIIRKVGALHDMLISDEHIAAVLQGEDNVILPDDIKTAIYAAAKQHANDILNRLRELQVDLRANPAIFIGGGSILLRPFFEASRLVAKADFVESPNANAIGYEMLARKQLSLRPTE